MLKNLLNDLKAYIETHKAEEVKFYTVKKQMLERYNDQVYQQKAAEAQAAYLAKTNELFNEYQEKVQKQFVDAEKAIRSLVMISIPQDMINAIKIIEELNNPTMEEINAIYEATKNSYLASKRVHETISRDETLTEKMKAYFETGVEPFFMPIDLVIQEITSLKSYVMGSVFSASTTEFSKLADYKVENVLHGGMISAADESINRFLDRYKA